MKTTSNQKLWLSFLFFLILGKLASGKVIHRQVKVDFTAFQTLHEDSLSSLWEEFLLLDVTDWMHFSFSSNTLPQKDQFRFSRTAAQQVLNYFLAQGIDDESIKLQYSPKARISAYRSPKQNKITSHLHPEALDDQAFTFKNANGSLCELISGHQVFIPPSAFDTDLQGKITFTVKEAITQKDFLKSGLTAQSSHRMLASNGMFHFDAKCNNKSVELKNGKEIFLIMAFEQLTDHKNLDRYLTYNGDIQNSSVNWTPNYNQKVSSNPYNFSADLDPIATNTDETGDEYDSDDTYLEDGEESIDTLYIEDEYGSLEMFVITSSTYNPALSTALLKEATESSDAFMKVSKLGWINCDRFYECEKKSDLLVKVNGNQNASLEVYAVFKNINSIMPGYFPVEQKVYSKFNQLPEGEEVLFIAVVKSKDKVQFAYNSQKTQEHAVVNLNLAEYTSEQYAAIMNDLLPD